MANLHIAAGADGERRLTLSGPMTIYEAAQLKEPLLAAVAGDALLRVDASAVDEIDTAGLQLLLLARREAVAQGGGLLLEARSEAVAEVLQRYGLADDFTHAAAGAPR